MRFTKMHGLGNDYLYVFGEVPNNASELSIKLSNRHFGAGSDGIIWISHADMLYPNVFLIAEIREYLTQK